ncbi:MAG: hypothetical protein P1U32_03945 [Legionellaceae bacterium]|nr:hypothetical protein [Legionellaceae bacterium]
MPALAMVQFGAAQDVTAGFDKMFRAKEHEGFDVRFIDALNLSEDDLAFLKSKHLKQINFISHSLSWQPFSSTRIPHAQRRIGDATLDTAIELTEWLSAITHAKKFNFYSCEIADKTLKNGTELRDVVQTSDAGGVVRTVDLTDQLSNFKSRQGFFNPLAKRAEAYVSSFDVLVAAVARGKMKNPYYAPYTPLECGGQVSLGDPENSAELASPRVSIRREEAHPYLQSLYTQQGVETPCVQRADERNTKRLLDNKRTGKHTIAWDRRLFLFTGDEQSNIGATLNISPDELQSKPGG